MVNRVFRTEPEFAALLNQGRVPKRRTVASLRSEEGRFIPVQPEADIPQRTEYDLPLTPEAAKSLASIEGQSVSPHRPGPTLI